MVEWAPLSTPINRRLQTLAAGIWIYSLIFFGSIAPLIFLCYLILGGLLTKAVCIIYIIHIYLNKDLSDHGGRGHGIKWMRENIYFDYFRAYFPVDLIKTVDLKPNRNYLFASYPHGVICCGVYGNFISMSPKFKKYFPGIRPRVLTLKINFQIPFLREVLYSWGAANASAESITTLLSASNDPKDSSNSDGNSSTAVVVVVGGAQEAINSHPNNYQIVINKRKGFIRLAIKTGSPIVPVFSFGEVDIFDQPANPSGSFLRRFQEKIKQLTGIAPIFVLGRGFLQYSFGFLPYRKPVTTVVGAPIEVIKSDSPTKEYVDKIHDEFVTNLKALFDKYKSKYIPDAPNLELILE